MGLCEMQLLIHTLISTGGLTKASLKLGHWYVITSHSFMRMSLLIKALISIRVLLIFVGNKSPLVVLAYGN